MLLVEADFIILENAMCDEAHWLHLPNHKNLKLLWHYCQEQLVWAIYKGD